MLYIGYLIFENGQERKTNQFQKFPQKPRFLVNYPGPPPCAGNARDTNIDGLTR